MSEWAIPDLTDQERDDLMDALAELHRPAVVLDPADPALRERVTRAMEDACLEHLGRDLGTIHRDDIVTAVLAALTEEPA